MSNARKNDDPHELVIRSLEMAYGNFVAVKNLSLEVAKGEVLGLLGPSGCGKTSILRCIGGLEVPAKGEIQIGGRTVFSSADRIFLPPERRGLGIVYQSYALWPHLSVLENVAFPLRYTSFPASEYEARTRDALAKVKLDGLQDRLPVELSGGQQQRVALARAIVAEPSALLFDEPLSNLDTQLRTEVRVQLRLLLTSLNITAIYITHDQREAMSICDRIAVMRDGVVEQIGSGEDIYRTPANEFVASFVGEANLVTASEELVRFLPSSSMDDRRPRTIVIRPEQVELRRSSEDARPADILDGRVSGRLFVGEFIEYVVEVRELKEQLLVHSSIHFDEGEHCEVVIDWMNVALVHGSG